MSIDLILEVFALICAFVLFPIVSEHSAKFIQILFKKLTHRELSTKNAAQLGVGSTLIIFAFLVFLYLEFEVRFFPFLS